MRLQLQSGKDGTQALIDASLSRLRPVTMASLTTVLGMLPLLFDDMFGSLAAAIMGGLIAGTVIVLIVIPVLYSLFFKLKKG
jgi:multidrug efflux pump subunit AcrB